MPDAVYEDDVRSDFKQQSICAQSEAISRKGRLDFPNVKAHNKRVYSEFAIHQAVNDIPDAGRKALIILLRRWS